MRNIYARLPYVGPEPYSIHLRAARLPLVQGYPVLVGPFGDRAGILRHVAGHWEVDETPLGKDVSRLCLDLRQPAGLDYAAEWFANGTPAVPNVHALFDAKPERAPVLAHLLYLRKVNKVAPNGIISDADNLSDTTMKQRVDNGMIFDGGDYLYAVIGRMP